MAALYGFLSEMTHIPRSRVVEIVGPELRIMPIGPHPDARLRGGFVYYTGVHLMESVAAVGFAIGPSLGSWAVERTQGWFQKINTLLKEVPLDPEAMRGD